MQVERDARKGREMRTEITEPWWLTLTTPIIGFEDDSDDDDGDDEGSDDEEEESEDSDDESEDEDEDEESEDEDKGKGKGENTDGLKSALRKERMARKKAERELRKLKTPTKPAPKKDEKSQEGEDKEDSSAADAEALAKSKRLAESLRTKAVDAAILRFTEKFQDPEDVLRLVNRGEIDVDQDEDDPSEIEVDLETVEDAIKALAKKKPHLLKSKRAGVKSGSQFGGAKKSGKKEMSDEELRKKYPALRQ